MAEATIETSAGTKINVEGTAEEVSEILKLYQQKEAKHETSMRTSEFKKFTKQTSRATPTVSDTIKEIVDAGFFDTPKGLAELKATLEQQGRFIPITSLSSYALDLTKKKILRRNKDDNGLWKYSKW